MLDCAVAVIGAGFGGIAMGVALKRAGIEDFLIFDKGHEVGGVWRENTYPGCSCDVPSHLYSLSCAPYRDRRVRYPGQPEILAYLRRVTDEHGLARHLRLGVAIAEATYLDDTGHWRLGTECGHHSVAEVVVFAVGQLHRPNIPDLPGGAEFGGPAFHSAEWDHGVDLRDRTVAVIGTGSSAAQMLPDLAATARRVFVFQRTPHWVLPKPRPEFGPVTRAALRIPGAHRLYRRMLYHGADRVLAPVMRRGWSARPVEWAARRHLRRHVPDPALRAKLTPGYPIGGKRIVFDSRFYTVLNCPAVELVTEAIERVTVDGIQTVDGTLRRCDVLIYATGFRASEFLVPVTVRGRGGAVLHEQWATGASAFLGVAVPGYPNAFLIAGPNTFNPAGSNPTMKECQVDFIVRCLRWRAELGAAAIEVTAEAAHSHQLWLAKAMAKTVWPAMEQSWYKHGAGRVTNPWPASARAFGKMLRRHPAESFTVVRIGDRGGQCADTGRSS
ncbi:flavin-containing monooxygenase [Nocardia bhagyanarayanae]|uniref:Cation diffusion facilitator CzcD-associated flavoprotein CzcO n=1 Tax=Nocardia bhagyanarayanae TaxID=1215925 RepID=A0A543FCY2_9NOCA|nr:NAD(P)/FAD-dependent oxidoreductase [Nocardia bhagyanarayanae]TQM31730.1 cation diffusion facilitator CzcD-associated flavoprotein CzcO [Nocardia bhagyanarayanae]